MRGGSGVDFGQVWAKWGPRLGYLLLGLIIAHNKWHIPMYSWGKSWVVVAMHATQPKQHYAWNPFD